jgi:pyruvate/2-oxoglutarate dehydrogenase complex dihydrolipoamide acyltransferase (E2) component
MVILGLSWDHRALDGAVAARFLASIKKRVEGYEA